MTTRLGAAPVLVTSRLTLRAHTAADFEACVAMWADEDVVRHIGGKPSSRDASWARMLRFPGLWALLGYGYWLAEETATGSYVGDVGLADFRRDMTPSIEGIPEAGWVLARAHHGKGYASEAMTAIFEWADRMLSAPRTCCIISPGNDASIRVAGKMGFGTPRPAQLGEEPVQLFFRDRAAR